MSRLRWLPSAGARRRPGSGMGPASPGGRHTRVTRSGGQVVVDIDATLVTAHSDKEGAEPTFKRGFGFAPMCTFVDHGEQGTGEPLAIDLRPGRPRRGTAPTTSPRWTPLWRSFLSTSAARCWSAPTPAPARRCSCTTSVTLGWSTRSGSRPKTLSRRRSRRSPSRPGGQPWMVTVNLAMAPRSPSSPPGCRRRSTDPSRPRPEGLATEDAGHRSPRTPPPRRPTAAD